MKRTILTTIPALALALALAILGACSPPTEADVARDLIRLEKAVEATGDEEAQRAFDAMVKTAAAYAAAEQKKAAREAAKAEKEAEKLAKTE